MSACNTASVCKPQLPFFVLDHARQGSRVTYGAEESIYCDGDPVEHWYEVICGGVRACKLLSDGRRQVIEFYLPGDQFGFDDLDGLHSVSAEAVAAPRTVLMRHNRRRLNSRIASDPDLSGRVRDLVQRSLMQTRFHLVILGRLEALERVASFLLEMETRLFEQSGHDAPGSFSLPMDRKDVADYLGITPETLSRCMQTLRRNGTISFPSQRQIRILDREALVSISGSALDLAGGVFSHAADRLPAVA